MEISDFWLFKKIVNALRNFEFKFFLRITFDYIYSCYQLKHNKCILLELWKKWNLEKKESMAGLAYLYRNLVSQSKWYTLGTFLFKYSLTFLLKLY